MLRNMMGWGGEWCYNVPWTYPHGWCYATWWGGVGWGMMLMFLELTHMVDGTTSVSMGVAETYRCQNTTRLCERTSKNFEDLSQNAKTQVVSAFTKKRTFVTEHNTVEWRSQSVNTNGIALKKVARPPELQKPMEILIQNLVRFKPCIENTTAVYTPCT